MYLVTPHWFLYPKGGEWMKQYKVLMQSLKPYNYSSYSQMEVLCYREFWCGGSVSLSLSPPNLKTVVSKYIARYSLHMFSGCWVHASQHNKHKHQKVNLNLSLIDCYCYYHPFKKVDCISNLICFPVKHLKCENLRHVFLTFLHVEETKHIIIIIKDIIKTQKKILMWSPT